MLWGEGEVACLSSPHCVAIVGARHCSTYGTEIAFDLARDLAREGVVVVSGLAHGIDTAAHQGALAGGGRTVAVLGCGIDQTYPAANRDLRKKVASSGAVISEYPAGTKAAPWTFPRRNRIISGLCKGVVVVEAGLKSGSLITADQALQQNREVFAVPGDIRSPLNAGAHHLIQSGAKLVTGIRDILQELGWQDDQRPLFVDRGDSGSDAADGDEGKVMSILKKGPRHIDELAESLHLPMDRVSEILVQMEIGGKINSLAGSRFARAR